MGQTTLLGLAILMLLGLKLAVALMSLQMEGHVCISVTQRVNSLGHKGCSSGQYLLVVLKVGGWK